MSWAVIPDIISTQALATINNMTCTSRSGLRLCLYTGLRSAADHFMFAELSSSYHNINRSAGQAPIADSKPEPSARAEMASRASWRTCNGPAPDCPPSVGAAQPCRLPPSPLHTFVSSSSRVTSHFNISSPNTQIESLEAPRALFVSRSRHAPRALCRRHCSRPLPTASSPRRVARSVAL